MIQIMQGVGIIITILILLIPIKIAHSSRIVASLDDWAIYRGHDCFVLCDIDCDEDYLRRCKLDGSGGICQGSNRVRRLWWSSRPLCGRDFLNWSQEIARRVVTW